MMDTADLTAFDPSTVTGLFYPRAFTISVTSAGMKVIGSDPTRVMIAFFFPPGGFPVPNIGVTFGSGLASGAYWPLSTSVHKFKYADWGALVGYEWYARGDSYPWTLAIWEVCYRVRTTQTARDSILCSGDRYNRIARNGSTSGRRFADWVHILGTGDRSSPYHFGKPE